ncbi:MAG: AAA family ATPase [Bacteroidetes bacterium]|nr:AAA family ATPase [Bacteroidota bacterium]
METTGIKSLLSEAFNYDPTPGQQRAIDGLAAFISAGNEEALFILKGYAGTGKTTLVSALVKVLPQFRIRPILLAPTGRAAKVLGHYSGRKAYTIHKMIYRKASGPDGIEKFTKSPNLFANAIFIVDEASMISGYVASENMFNQGSLLEDLLGYVREGENCKIIFIGDGAQLPPVGSPASPALDAKFLERNFSLNVSFEELTDVVRQKEESGILENATAIRGDLMNEKNISPKFKLKGFSDIISIDGTELEDALNSSYSNYGTEETMVICRSNKRANIFNKQIRARILWKEEEISAGDLMMVVKNNYFWLTETSAAGFIANGDIIEILKVKGYRELYGFRFADVSIKMIDYPGEPEMEVKLLLNTIDSDAPSLSQAENRKLYDEVSADYMHIPIKRERFLKLKKDPFFNALQVKFAYAVTCHKAQGGQWPCVFVEQGYLTEEMVDKEYLRWLYTAITRATEKLYLVNFNESFFHD